MYIRSIQWNAVAACSGEELAHEALIQRYAQRVFNLAGRLIEDPSGVATVMEKVFRKVFRNAGTFRDERTLEIWIYRLVVSETRRRRRWFRRQVRRESPSPIEEALRTIDLNMRAALVLREIEELSYDEISVILEVSSDTVESLVLKGRDALRKNVAARRDPSGDALAPSERWQAPRDSSRLVYARVTPGDLSS